MKRRQVDWLWQLQARVEAVQGRVVVCGSREEAANVIAEEIQRRRAGVVYVGTLGEEWLQRFRKTPGMEEVRFLEPLSPDAPEAISEVGLSEVDYAVAETGTLVEIARQRESHLPSLLPPVHIALLAEDRIFPDLDSCFVMLSDLVRTQPRPRVVFITGPSRSADIEKLLILGAHGPRELIVVVYPP